MPYKDKQRKKEYMKEYWKKWYGNNREHKKECNKKWHINNPEYNKKYIRQWRKDNPKKAKLQYRKENEKRKEYNKLWGKNNPEKIKRYHKVHYEKMKEYIDNYKLLKGCPICGYNKCAEALDFHHTDNNKDFAIGAGLTHKSLRLIKKEMAKCIVLCRNCHAELHAMRLIK